MSTDSGIRRVEGAEGFMQAGPNLGVQSRLIVPIEAGKFVARLRLVEPVPREGQEIGHPPKRPADGRRGPIAACGVPQFADEIRLTRPRRLIVRTVAVLLGP